MVEVTQMFGAIIFNQPWEMSESAFKSKTETPYTFSNRIEDSLSGTLEIIRGAWMPGWHVNRDKDFFFDLKTKRV